MPGLCLPLVSEVLLAIPLKPSKPLSLLLLLQLQVMLLQST